MVYTQLKLKNLSKLLAFGLISFIPHASAAIVLQKISVLTGLEYESNPAFNSSNKRSVWRATALPTYTASLVEERNRWFTTAGLSVQRSSDSAVSESRQDPNLLVGWEHEYERGTFNIIADYSKTSSRLNEFTSNGVVDQDGSATTKSISASWTRLLTERLNLSAQGQYSQINYAGSGLSNYKSKSLNTSLTYELNERVSPFVQIGISELNSELNNTQSRFSKSLLVGATAMLRPNLNMSASAGVNHRQGSGVGLVANVSMSYLAERYNLQGNLSRNVTPSGIGEFQQTNNLNVRYVYDLSDKSKIGSDFAWSSNNSAGSNGSAGGNNTLQAGGWYSRELSESLQFRVNLNRKQLSNAVQSANSNIVGISLNYNTPDF